MTNELLKKNAPPRWERWELLVRPERSVVDLERTWQHTNQQLIATLDEVMDIQRQGAEKRRNAEPSLAASRESLSRSSATRRNRHDIIQTTPAFKKRVVCVFRHNSEIGEAGIPRHRLAGRTLQAEHSILRRASLFPESLATLIAER
ncbi:MAG: toxic anion resistance protein [Oscillospiraceae bacterium]